MTYATRPIITTDEPFLWEMLYYVAHMDEEPGVSVETAKTNPFLARHVANWGRRGDMGFIALGLQSQQPIGAAWVRLFVGKEKACKDIDDYTPELAIAVVPEYLGHGVGSQLLTQLLSAAKTAYPAVYLNVRATNPAKRLYERFGFVVIGELTNRVGSTSFHMKVDFL